MNARIRIDDPAADGKTSSERRAASQPGRPRRRLWDVHERYMCSLVGTCLGVGEIRKIALRDKLCRKEISDYDLHGLIVGVCRSRSRTSRSLHKVLERRYHVAVKRFAKAHTEKELTALWTEGVDAGDIAGPLWALLTHPDATTTVMELAFGDVHMLSHALGASRRVDLKEHERLKVDLSKERKRTSRLKQAVKRRDDALAANRESLAQREGLVQELLTRLAEDRSRSELLAMISSLRDALSTREQALGREMALREDAERHARRLDAEVERLARDLQQAESDRDAAAAETEAMETHLLALAESDGDDASDHAPPRTLDGVSVLYVGGRTHLVPHYRSAVEARGGSFVHHDGGLEQSCSTLESLVSAADRVLCPVDAVSHNASLRVKKACKHHGCPFVALRTSSMASLVSAAATGLEGTGDEPTESG